MAAHHLVGDARGDRLEIEQTRFSGHLGVEHDLEQQVAKLVLEGGPVLAVDGLGDLVGFLDGIGRDGGEALLDVPGTARVGIPELRHHVEESINRAHPLKSAGGW